MKIMIVEDDQLLRDYLVEAMQSLNHTVYPAGSTSLALKKLEKHEPELFLIDIVMPGNDGIYLCEELRANPRFFNTPIIMMTGISASDDVIDRAFDGGADDFLLKPINLRILERRIDIVEWKKSSNTQIPQL
jgi:DNA-binding response OmpR family regulator